MSRLIVVSNRVSMPEANQPSSGGLAVGVQAALQDSGGIWFGWNGNTCATLSPPTEIESHGNIQLATMALNEADFELYYNGFSNSSLWPILHYLIGFFKFERQAFEAYWRVNSFFAERLLPLIEPDDIVWVHDYHLIPLACELREAGVQNALGFFLHVPFPAYDMLRVLPVHRSLLRALCLFDVVGFQTEMDRDNFMDAAARSGMGVERVDECTLRMNGHECRADVYPIGIDVDGVARLAEQARQHADFRRLVDSLVGRELLIGVDRLDYSKGLEARFRAYERLLSKYPTHRLAVTYMQIAPPTRTGVRAYDEIRSELEQVSGNINGRFATTDWVPLRYLNAGLDRTRLMGVLRAARVGLVTPVRDGMNLVAKEFIASQDPADPGMLVLSSLAGSAVELEAAVLVNPYDTEDMADGMAQALAMPLAERRERYRAMLEVLRRDDITNWRQRFVADLQAAGERRTAAEQLD